jgi:N6-adenosine-specific RNA methylase IME4
VDKIRLPRGKYNIIYADPPWTYKAWSKKGEGRTASHHYDVMVDEDIYNMPVQKIANDNCILLLWVTFPKLLEGIETMKRWGFTYKTCAFAWIKTNKNYNTKQFTFLPEDSFSSFWGMGYWTRANAELCLLGTVGKPKRVSKSVHQVIYEPIEKHSKKPNFDGS